MKREKRLLLGLTPFQAAECLVILLFTVWFALTNTSDPLWYILTDAAAAVCGVFCVVLCAAGRKSQYYWGLVNIAAYIVLAWRSRYWGEVMLNAFYYLPTQFIGLRVWARHYNDRDDAVEGLRLKPSSFLLWAAASAAGIFLYRLLLKALGGQAALLDSMSTVLSLAANALMVLRYREQWAIWIVVDGVTVIMWIIAGDWLMTVMWSIYLINAVYGWIHWTRLSRGSEA